MKTALPWVLVVVLFGGIYFLYSANKEKESEIARLSQASADLDTLRQENDDLKKQIIPHDEMVQLRKDSEELLKTRAEVQRLRQENKQLGGQLTTARSQAAQVQQASQQLASENQSLLNQAQQAQTVAQQQTDACINNLRQIDGAKQQWALENHKAATDVPTAADISAYITNQITCPTGGAYSINAVGTPATCTIPGHALK